MYIWCIYKYDVYIDLCTDVNMMYLLMYSWCMYIYIYKYYEYVDIYTDVYIVVKTNVYMMYILMYIWCIYDVNIDVYILM